MSHEDRRTRPPAEPCSGVRVVCRLRPMNEREKRSNTVPAATASTERREVVVSRNMGTRQVRSCFHFDDVLTSFSNQSEVFSATLEPLVGEVLAGYEATAFAYGQTGTGKTYTMEGNLDSDEGRGLVPRAAAAVIGALALGDYSDYSVTVSYLEIYNEELSDLLAPNHLQQKLDLKDVGSGKGVCCIGLSEVAVSSVSDILSLVHRAQERRRVAETRVNARSSRSHSIFTMKVRCRRTVGDGELENTGKLHLVDLAGSECAKKASAPLEDGTTQVARNPCDEERERRAINQSLLTLGRVISALRDGTGRVPYRDSKLTRLLQDALGGRCKTVIIATISPALGSVEETISTLTYAEQACAIKNKPVASSLIRSMRMAAGGEMPINGVDFNELELRLVYLTQEVEEAQVALARQYRDAQEAADRAAAAEEKVADLEAEVRKVRLLAEEQSYARTRLSAFADGRVVLVKSLDEALAASSEYGENLSQRLEACLKVLEACKGQGRQICDAVGVQSASLSEATAAKCKAVTAAVSETHSMHLGTKRMADCLIQAHQNTYTELAAALESRKDQLATSTEQLACEAEEALDQEEARAQQALASAEAAADTACRAAGRLGVQTSEAAAAARAALATQSSSLCVKLEAKQQGIVAGSTSDASALQAANHELDSLHVAVTCRVDLVRQGLDQLVQSMESTQQEAARNCEALKDSGSVEVEAGKASDSRWQQVLSLLEVAAAKHVSGTEEAAGDLRELLLKLKEEVNAGVSGTLNTLQTADAKLEEGRKVLASTTRNGQSGVDAGLNVADEELSKAWTCERTLLAVLAETLAEALRSQRQANASGLIHQQSMEATADLKSAMAESLTLLACSRKEVAAQLGELQEQCANEQLQLRLLQDQKSALEADVDALKRSMEAMKTEIATSQASLSKTMASQAARRQKAMETILHVVTAEMDGMGQELDGDIRVIEDALGRSDTLASGAMEAAQKAMLHNQSVGHEIGAVASAWSQAVAAACVDVREAQGRADSAATSAQAAQVLAQGRLEGLARSAAAWGEGCDNVAGLVDKAAIQLGELQSDLSQLPAQWSAARRQAMEAASAWAGGSEIVSGMLEEASSASGEASRGLQSMSGSFSSSVATANEKVLAWEHCCKSHSESLEEMASVGRELRRAAAKVDEERAGSLCSMASAAEELLSSTSQNSMKTADILDEVMRHLAVMPADHKAASSALVAGEVALQGITSKASSALEEAVADVASLCCAHDEAIGAMLETVSKGTSAVTACTEECSSVLDAERKAASACTKRWRERWQRAKVGASGTIKAMQEATAKATEQAASASEAGSLRIAAELEKGTAAYGTALASVESLVSTVASTLSKDQAALQAALSAPPLATFMPGSEKVPGLPEAARRLQVILLDRPSDEMIVQEFRAQREGPRKNENEDFEVLRENIVSGKMLDRDVCQKIAKGRPDAPRTVLGELNRAR